MWRYIVRKNAAAAMVVIAIVGIMLIAELNGYQITSRWAGRVNRITGYRSEAREIGAMLIVPVAFTTPAALLALLWIRRAYVLARRGVAINGKLRRVGGIVDFPWLRRSVFSYLYDGKAYQKSVIGGNIIPDVGSPVQIMVDPRKPSRCMLRIYVLPPGYDPAFSDDITSSAE
jgi:hypothetical protein